MKKITFLLLAMMAFVFASAQDAEINQIVEGEQTQDSIKEMRSRLYGPFTINQQGDKVYFSQGNLQYQASTDTWRFAEHQWDFVGDDTDGNVFENDVKCNNALTSNTYDGWIDVFGWGTGQNPTFTGCTYDDIDKYREYHEWGDNKIINGIDHNWRSLTSNEWYYLLMRNRNIKTIKVSYVNVDLQGIQGVILLPDTWNNENYQLSNNSNINLSISDWYRYFESQGAVFMPVTHKRECNTMQKPKGNGDWGTNYWSSSQRDDYFGLDNHGMQLQKFYGLMVRLVTDLK